MTWYSMQNVSLNLSLFVYRTCNLACSTDHHVLLALRFIRLYLERVYLQKESYFDFIYCTVALVHNNIHVCTYYFESAMVCEQLGHSKNTILSGLCATQAIIVYVP